MTEKSATAVLQATTKADKNNEIHLFGIPRARKIRGDDRGRAIDSLFCSRSNAIICKRGKDDDKDPGIEFVGRSGGFCCC